MCSIPSNITDNGSNNEPLLNKLDNDIFDILVDISKIDEFIIYYKITEENKEYYDDLLHECEENV